MTADDEPGDPVCWLHELCPVCGAMPTPEQPDRCWRCGHPLPADGSSDSPTAVPLVE